MMARASDNGQQTILSPLRYPGAKRRLATYLADAMLLNGMKPRLYVEPFAGGASVALHLLCNGLVDEIALGERDPIVASFWKVVFYDSDWLVEQLSSVEVTVEQWDKFRSNRGRTNRDRALACLFLNRTSFSGILAKGAGPIGGRAQESEYKVDCRFNASSLAKRIQQAARLAPKVRFVECADWADTMAKAESLGLPEADVMYYMDPPFYRRAERLYRFWFGPDDHQALHDSLMNLRSPWALSYDPSREIVDLYSDNGRGARHVELLYSLRGATRPLSAKELIVSNLKRLPRRTKLWRAKNDP